MDSEPQTRIAAEDYLDALAANGIDHLFCNPGTDFAPIVEAFARAARTNRKVPRPMVVPHENAAMSMAHGYTMVTGKPQAVMLHTNVGTANAINMLIDASRDRVPVLLTSGRTPFTETGAEGSRSAHIHWAQEMYDQAGMLREMVKWDYEMKRGDQVATVVDRALELAMASPKGPVYLSLPREVLGEVVHAPAESNRAHRARPRAPVPSAADIEQLADWIANARAPVVITSLLGQDPRDAVVLSRLAERWALPVIPYNTRYFAISANHPMFQGSMPGPLLDNADLVIVIEADVPWLPSKEAAAGRRTRRADRRGSALRALSDAQLSLRPDDHRQRAVGAGGAGAGAGGPRAIRLSRNAARGWSRVRANCTRNGAMRRSGTGAATRSHRPG